MRIATRLGASFMALLALLFIVAAVSLSRLENLRSVTQEIVDVRVRLVTLSHEADHHAQMAAHHLLQLLQTDDREQRIPLYTMMDREITEFDRVVMEIGEKGLSKKGVDKLDMLNESRLGYDRLFQITVETIEVNGVEDAREHFKTQTELALNALLQETAALSSQQQQDMQSDLKILRQAETNARSMIIVLSAIALLIGAAFSWIIAGSIVRPLHEAVAIAESIAAGDLSHTIPKSSADEMGKLLSSLGAMQDSIANREEKILKLAYEDTLTGLPNRTRFLEIFSGLSSSNSGMVAVLDINRFAMINNALGYAVGDLILHGLASRLISSELHPTLMARLWGDKFAFLLDGADHQAAGEFAYSVIAALQLPVLLSGQNLDVGGSLGIALYPRDGTDPSVLLRRAEAASHFAKRRHLAFAYASDIGDEADHEQLSLIGEMREAMDNREFVIHYQPKLHLSDDTINGAEALLRWNHPVRGKVPPGQFIPFAEQTGFIREITPWIIARVIEDASEWQRKGLTIIPSVNLSTLDLLDKGLLFYVGGLLERHGLEPGRLCFEITESALMEEPELALKHLNELSALGIKLSIDDFGSGHASLAYLKILPVNELKIDREFVTSVATLPKNAAIVRSTILLCHELGLTVVAEGAETDEELAWLKRNHCDIVQGYGIARPMANDELIEWMSAFNSRNG